LGAIFNFMCLPLIIIDDEITYDKANQQ
jgi:hypothetical protein